MEPWAIGLWVFLAVLAACCFGLAFFTAEEEEEEEPVRKPTLNRAVYNALSGVLSYANANLDALDGEDPELEQDMVRVRKFMADFGAYLQAKDAR